METSQRAREPSTLSSEVRAAGWLDLLEELDLRAPERSRRQQRKGRVSTLSKGQWEEATVAQVVGSAA